MLKAFKKVSKKINCELLIIGYGSNELKIKNYIRDNSLIGKIKILKYQENPYKFIRSSDLFILTSKYEGLPNVLLEAMVLKKFIISSNCPTGPREILNNGKGGLLFKSKNYKELAKKIVYFHKNKKKCFIMNKTSQVGLERFDFKKNLNKYYETIRTEI